MYLFLDLETNGSRYYHQPIELAYVLTDDKLDEVAACSFLIKEVNVSYLKEMAPDIVREMHEANGLWKALDKEITHSIYETDWLLYNSLKEHAPFMLAGAGVSHFDSLMLSRHFPRVWELIDGYTDSDYLKPTMDISVVRRFVQNFAEVNVPFEFPGIKGEPHRALYDVRVAIAQAKWMLEYVL